MADDINAAAVTEAIVVCETCDSVFRAHEGRGTCPCCGGRPLMVLQYLQPQPAPAESEGAEQDVPGPAKVSKESEPAPAVGDAEPPKQSPKKRRNRRENGQAPATP